MNTNIGKKERIIRFVVAVVVIALGYFVLSAGWVRTVAYVLGAVLLLTAAFGFCPAYMACPTKFGKKAAAKPAAKKAKKKK